MNLGTTPASFTIDFSNDAGFLQSLPFKEFGSNSTLTGYIAVGGRWTINSAGDLNGATITGTAFINNVTGNIGGYALFEYGGQSATVPIEAPGQRFIISFDGSNGWVQGIALVSPCGISNVNIIFRDSGGNTILVDNFTMTLWQHMSFVVSQRYPQLVGRWGTAYVSADNCINGLGILANSAGAYTTVFALDVP